MLQITFIIRTLAGGFPGWIRASFRHMSFIREIFFLVEAQPL